MGKYVLPTVLDAALDQIAAADLMVAINGQPATFAAAQTGKLAEVAMTPADFTLADGTTSGRRVIIAEKANVTVDTSGTADHVALLDTAGSRLLYVTTVTAPTALSAAGQVTFQTWDIEIADPV